MSFWNSFVNFFIQDLVPLWCKDVCYQDCHQYNLYLLLLDIILLIDVLNNYVI
jgi:hypothetical protein